MSFSLLVFMIRNTAKTEQTWWLAVIDLTVESEALWKIMQFHLMVVSFYLKTCGIINNYWTKLNKISWFVSGEQIIIHLRDSDKSHYFAIGESNNCFIIRSPSLSFYTTAIARRRKAWFHLRMSRILVAAKNLARHIWTTLCKSRPLFVGSYLQTMPLGGLPANKKNFLRMIKDYQGTFK